MPAEVSSRSFGIHSKFKIIGFGDFMTFNISSQVSAPDFELLDTQGRTIHLSDYRGKPVVLVLLRGFV